MFASGSLATSQYYELRQGRQKIFYGEAISDFPSATGDLKLQFLDGIESAGARTRRNIERVFASGMFASRVLSCGIAKGGPAGRPAKRICALVRGGARGLRS